MNAVTEQM